MAQPNARTEAIREIRRRWNATRGTKITESDARAMLRGECTTDQYRFAFTIAREYGL